MLANVKIGIPRPRTVIYAATALVILFAAIAMLAIPGAWLPGTAEATSAQGTVTLTFEPGDRYFWLPQHVQGRAAVDVLADIPGDQRLIQRSSYHDVNRLAYDEAAGKGDNFLVKADYLYEISGITTRASVQWITIGGDAIDFADQLSQGSSSLWKRLATNLASLPGIVWDDLKQIGTDLKDAFDGGESTTSEGEGGAKNWIQDTWQLLLTAILIIAAAPFLGLDRLWSGALIAIGFLAAGHWGLAALAVAAGLLFDDNSPRGTATLAHRILHGAGGGLEDKAREYPGITGAIIVSTTAFLLAALLAYLQHANLAAITLAAGAAFTAFLVREGVRNRASSDGEGAFGTQLAIGPAVLAIAMAAYTGWLAFLGYRGFAIGAAIIMLYAGLGAARVSTWTGSGRGLRGRAGDTWGRYTFSYTTRLILYLCILLAWIGTIALGMGDWIAALVYWTMAAVAVVYVVWQVDYKHIEAKPA